MTQYNTVKVELCNSQLNKLKSGIQNSTEVTLKLSSNVAGDSDNENNSPHNNRQVSKLRKGFANNPSANTKFSKTQLHKIGQSGGFLGRLLGALLKIGLPLMINLLKSSVKSVLSQLGLTGPASAIDAAIHKKCFGSGTHPSDLAKQKT